MKKQTEEKPVLLIIDMVKDYFREDHNYPITGFGRQIVEPINGMIRTFRGKGLPIVFSTDAFQPDDFIFKSKMKPHSLAGTTGAEVIDELDRKPEDYWLPKPRFSAFFNTGLERWLRDRNVTLCAVAGISTPVCVLATALDAISHDFKVVLLEDCTAAHSASVHQQTIEIFRRNALLPLLRVLPVAAFVEEL
jgi:nicotinamidase/pyrazinamidase